MSFDNSLLSQSNVKWQTGPKRKQHPDSKSHIEDDKNASASGSAAAVVQIEEAKTMILESDTSDDAYQLVADSLLEIFNELHTEMMNVYRSLFDAQKKIADIRAMHLHHSELPDVDIQQRAKERKLRFFEFRQQEGIALGDLMDLQVRVGRTLNSIRKEHSLLLQRMIALGEAGPYEELLDFSNDPIPDPSPMVSEKTTIITTTNKPSSAGQAAVISITDTEKRPDVKQQQSTKPVIPTGAPPNVPQQQPQYQWPPKPSNPTAVIDDESRRKITSEILIVNPKVRFDDVIGLEHAKQALREMVILPLSKPKLFTGLRKPSKGLLMYGPPGNGKTFLAKAAAAECKATFFAISSSSIQNKYVGESEKMMRALFTVARERAPSIIFIDEIDSLLTKRSTEETTFSEMVRGMKTEFLVQFDGVSESNDGVVVIGATNTPEALDDAVIRRLNLRVFVPPPNSKERRIYLSKLFHDQRTTITPEQANEIVAATKGFSASDLSALTREAANAAIRELTPAQLKLVEKPSDLRPISMNDMIAAVANYKASVSPERMEKYLAWATEQDRIRVQTDSRRKTTGTT